MWGFLLFIGDFCACDVRTSVALFIFHRKFWCTRRTYHGHLKILGLAQACPNYHFEGNSCEPLFQLCYATHPLVDWFLSHMLCQTEYQLEALPVYHKIEGSETSRRMNAGFVCLTHVANNSVVPNSLQWAASIPFYWTSTSCHGR